MVIAQAYKAKVVKNLKVTAEFGKYKAFKASIGDVIIFLDADNVIASSDWLKRMVKPLSEDEKIVGVESNYLISPDFSSINKYVSLLVIADPLARMLASKPSEIINRSDFIIKKFRTRSTPVTGANGFLWKKTILDEFSQGRNTLEETTILVEIAARSEVFIANIPGQGIYHYYCETLRDYIMKRHKIADKFLQRRKKINTWVDRKSTIRQIFSILYLISFIGPAIEGVYLAIKTKHIAWLWHPVVSFITIIVYIGHFLKEVSTKTR